MIHFRNLSQLEHRHYCFDEYLTSLLGIIRKINEISPCDAETRDVLEVTFRQLKLHLREIEPLENLQTYYQWMIENVNINPNID